MVGLEIHTPRPRSRRKGQVVDQAYRARDGGGKDTIVIDADRPISMPPWRAVTAGQRSASRARKLLRPVHVPVVHQGRLRISFLEKLKGGAVGEVARSACPRTTPKMGPGDQWRVP